MKQPPSKVDFKATIVDKAIGLISPSRMLNRMKSRAMANILDQQMRKYNAGTHSRRTAVWNAPGTSANAEISPVVMTLVNRSRDLVRNNPTAKRAIEAIADNVVGVGIRPSHYKGNKKNKTSDEVVRKAWQQFAETTACDWDGKNTFYGLQHLAVRTIAESGSVLIRKRWSRDTDVGIQYQVMEPDFIDRSKNSTSIAQEFGKPYDLEGRRYDSNGKLVGFWLFNMHPGDGWTGSSNLVMTDEVVHVYNVERPGQIDGVPVITTSAMLLKDFDEYEQAQLIRQKIAACFAVFITNSDGALPSEKDSMNEKLEPGIIQHVEAGKTVTFTTPPTVNNYDEYATSMLRRIASGLGLSYEVLTGDLSNVNFSSGRMGWIEFHRLIQRWQHLMLVPQMCTPMYKWFIQGCVLMGIIKAEPKGIVTWTPPRREMIDPAKEVKALIEMIRAGLKPFSEAMRELGLDPDVAIDDIIDDFKELRKYDLFLTCDPKFDPTRSNGALPDPNAGKENDGDPEEKTAAQLKKERALGILNDTDS